MPKWCDDIFSAPPGPPIPKVTDWTKSSVDLEWAPPAKDGGSKITGYIVEYKEEGKEEWEKVGETELYLVGGEMLTEYSEKVMH